MDGEREGGDIERPAPERRRRRRRLLWGLVAGAAAIGVVAFGIIGRENTDAALAVTADEESVVKVTLVSPKRGPKSRTLTLPGDVHAWYQAPIYAQVSGYVHAWFEDYGARVQRGQVLATIDTPDLDQQLQQSEAELEVAKARYQLAKVTATRWQKLSGTQAVSQQEVDVNVADATAQKSAVDAARYNVARYQAQEAFKRVVAPFDGVVTSRQTDVGDYVDAAGGNSSAHGSASELFSVADIHEMRIYVSVPQDYSGDLKPGLTATMTLPQFPKRTFAADYATTANSYNTQSRTVLTELTVPNPNHQIWPGAYAEVRFDVPTDPHILIIPEQSLLFRAEGLQVALVGADSKVHLQGVKIGLNLGETVQVLDGLKASDRLIANPSDGLLEGETVKVTDAPAANTDVGERQQSDTSSDQ